MASSAADARDVASGLSPFEARLGVWRGTIGSHGVMACLQRPYSDAVYYYIEQGAAYESTSMWAFNRPAMMTPQKNVLNCSIWSEGGCRSDRIEFRPSSLVYN